jgi:hypothetical protein
LVISKVQYSEGFYNILQNKPYLDFDPWVVTEMFFGQNNDMLLKKLKIGKNA